MLLNQYHRKLSRPGHWLIDWLVLEKALRRPWKELSKTHDRKLFVGFKSGQCPCDHRAAAVRAPSLLHTVAINHDSANQIKSPPAAAVRIRVSCKFLPDSSKPLRASVRQSERWSPWSDWESFLLAWTPNPPNPPPAFIRKLLHVIHKAINWYSYMHHKVRHE